MEKLSPIDAHMLGLKRKFILDQKLNEEREEKKRKEEEQKLKQKDSLLYKNFSLGAILNKVDESKIEKVYNPMEQRSTQKSVRYLSLYKNNVLQQVQNCKLRLENSEDFSVEKERHQKEYDRLLKHKNFIFQGFLHAYL